MKDIEKFIDEKLEKEKISLSSSFADGVISLLSNDSYIDSQLAKEKISLDTKFSERIIFAILGMRRKYFLKLGFVASIAISAITFSIFMSIEKEAFLLDEEYYISISEKSEELLLLAAIITEQELITITDADKKKSRL